MLQRYSSHRLLNRLQYWWYVVGGGVIGCEYASIFAALGTKVTLIEGRDRLLTFVDAELSSALKVALERMGADIRLGDAVERIHREPGLPKDALRLELKSGRVLSADKVLFSAGRRGNTEGLGLDAAGVVFDGKGRIPVDGSFRTNVPWIFAAGDVVGFPALAATSMEQGRVAACRAFDLPFKTAVAPVFPYGVYTIPEISMIGASEEELKAKGIPYEVGRARYENNARGQILGDTDGLVKLLFDPGTRKLLGAHLVGTSATDLVHVPQMVMVHGGGLDDFLDAVFNVPTLSECFKYAAYDGLQRLAHRTSAAPLGMDAPGAGGMPAPLARAWFVGLDLSAVPGGGEAVVAEMDRWNRVRFRTWAFDAGASGLLPDRLREEGFVLAVAAPQGLASQGGKARVAERELRRGPGTPDRLTRLGTVRERLAADGAALFSSLRAQGYGLLGEVEHERTALLEVLPEDLFTRWAGRRLPPRGEPAGRRARFDLLESRGIELGVLPGEIDPQRLAAAASAWAAYLWSAGRAREYGVRPVADPGTGLLREGLIVSL